MSNLESPGAPEPVQHGIASRIRTYFLTGLIVAGPVAITIWLVWSFVTWVMIWCGRSSRSPIGRRRTCRSRCRASASSSRLSLTLGFLTANLVGRTFVEIGEMILERVPIVRPIYRGLKQVFETLFSKSGSSFRTVGLVEFPAPGMWSLVFLSMPPGADLSAQLPSDAEYVSAFMPCTPNPTTGFFFYVLRRDVIELTISVEDAAKLLMSAGMIQPGGNGEQHKKLAALAETARAARAVPTSTAAE